MDRNTSLIRSGAIVRGHGSRLEVDEDFSRFFSREALDQAKVSRRRILTLGAAAFAMPLITPGLVHAANVQKLIAGGVSSYTTCGFAAADFNSLGNNGFALATSGTVTNASNLDVWAEVSFIVTMGGTTAAPNAAFIYWYPQNQDGSTYGDGASSGNTPGQTYLRGMANVLVGVSSGGTITGTTNIFPLTRSVAKFGFKNATGAAFNATASATCAYRTTNINNNG
jgi:hypothetical protein